MKVLWWVGLEEGLASYFCRIYENGLVLVSFRAGLGRGRHFGEFTKIHGHEFWARNNFPLQPVRPLLARR